MTESKVGRVYLYWREESADFDIIENVLSMDVTDGCLRLVVLDACKDQHGKTFNQPLLRIIPLDRLEEVQTFEHVPADALQDMIGPDTTELPREWGLTLHPGHKR
jgi:hypothetical protein